MLDNTAKDESSFSKNKRIRREESIEIKSQ